MSQKSFLLLLLVLLIAFIYRLIIVLNTSLTFFSDDAVYASLAESLVNLDLAHFIHPFWPPLYPLISAVLYLFLPHWELALRMSSVLAGVLILIPLFLLVRITFTDLMAFLFTLVFSFFSSIFEFSIFPLSDTVSTMFTISAITAVFFALNSFKRSYYLFSAFLFGLNYLARPEGLMFFSLTIFFLFFYFFFKLFLQKQRGYYFLVTILIMIVIFFATISPYLTLLRLKLGQWTLSSKFSAQIQQEHAFVLRDNNTTWAQEIWSIKNPNYQSPYFKNAFNYIIDHEYSLRKQFPEKLLKWGNIFFKVFPSWSTPLIVLGLFSILFSRLFKSQIYLIYLMVPAILITNFSTALADIRYLLWAIPVLFYFFYLGVGFIFKVISYILKFKDETKFYPLAAFLTLIASLYFPIFSKDIVLHPLTIYATDFTKKYYQPEILEISKIIKNQNSFPRVMMKYEMVEFYSGGQTIYLPQANYLKILKYAEDHHVDYLVFWQNELETNRDLKDLLNYGLSNNKLKLIYVSTTPAEKIYLYSFSNY